MTKFFNSLCLSCRNFSCTKWNRITHYDILKLKRDCTQKDIRNAYLKLCKENHPDRDKGDVSLHKKFVEISEAYNVLSKPSSRKRYDESIAFLEQNKKIRNVIYQDNHYSEEYRRAWGDTNFYHNRKEEIERNIRNNSDERYYGIKGIKRVSNATIFVILVTISLLSGFFQIIAIKNSLIAQERARISEENARLLKKIKDNNALKTEAEILDEIERTYYQNLEKIDPHFKK